MAFPIPPPTERLRFRPWSLNPEDMGNLNSLFGNPKVMTHYPRVKTPAEMKDFIILQRLSYRENKMGLYALDSLLSQAARDGFKRMESGGFIGQCGATIQIVNDHPEAEIGYHIRPEFWDQGYASEAARGVLQWLKKNGYPQPICLIDPQNGPSQNVAQALGMKINGQALMWNKIHDVWRSPK